MLNDTKEDIKTSVTNHQTPSQTIKKEKFSSRFNQQPISDAVHVAALKKMIMTIPDNNQERINYLRTQIASDNYIINNHHIAMQMQKAFETVK